MSKYFNVSNPSQIITIVSDQNSFYQLSDGNMIKKESFMSKYQPVLEGFETEHISTPSYTNTERIDPSSFFSATSLSTTDINTIKSTDPSIVPNIPDGVERSEIKINTTDRTNIKQPAPQINETLVSRVDNQVIPNNTKTDVSQYKVYDDDEEAYNDFINNSGITIKKPEPKKEIPTTDPMIEINSLFDDELLAYGQDEANNRRNKRISKLNGVPQNNQQQTSDITEQTIHAGNPTPNYQPTIDPINMMFSTFKRSHEVTFNFEFKDKIANPEFIKMMMENMDGDIVGYYKKMIVDNIMKNLHVIEGIVEKELKELLTPEEVVKVSKPKKVVKVVKKPVREPIPEETEVLKKPKRPEIRVIPDVPTIPFTKEPRTKKS